MYYTASRAGRRSWGTIVFSRERPELSRTIPLFQKKNEHRERILKNIETIIKRMNMERTKIAEKNFKIRNTCSYHQEHVFLSPGTCVLITRNTCSYHQEHVFLSPGTCVLITRNTFLKWLQEKEAQGKSGNIAQWKVAF